MADPSTSPTPAKPIVHRAHFPVSVKFESGEHVLIGDSVTLHFESGDVVAKQRKLQAYQTSGSFPSERYYTFGEVLALGGDFLGDPRQPISDAHDPVAQFRANLLGFYGLAYHDEKQVNDILALMHEEMRMIQAALRDHQDPANVYEKIGDEFSFRWNQITGGGYGVIPEGRYIALAKTNWDHFGDGAVISYRAGHHDALATAAYAGASNSPKDRDIFLQIAYVKDAYACHFLTDLFSAGHLRTPRKALAKEVAIAEVGGLLARCMHDEDSKNGLVVSNARGTTWTAYGDKQLFSQRDAGNWDIVQKAVQASVDEVWDVFRSKKAVDTFDALNYIPDLSRVRDFNDRRNGAPLFIQRRGLECRNNLGDRGDYSWTNTWAGPTTLAQLKLLGWAKDIPWIG